MPLVRRRYRYQRILDSACSFFTDSNVEVRRLKRNWLVLYANAFLLGLAFAISYPSLHQFVTTPANIAATKDIRPGLGLSETFYSCTIAIFPVGELVTGIVFAVAVKYVSVKSLLCLNLILITVGSVLYGTAVNGAMILLGRCLQGCFTGGLSHLARTYMGETANLVMKLKNEDPQTSQTKNTLFVTLFGISALSVVFGPGFAPIVAQFPSIDPFRWPGWVVATAGLFLLVVHSIVFVEKPSDINRKGTNCSVHKMKPAVPFWVLAVILVVFSASGFGFAVVEALLNPFLAAMFGFNIEYTSYVYIGTVVMFCFSQLSVHLMHKCKLKNKLICVIGAIICWASCLMMVDWQSLGGDPCDRFSYDQFNSTAYWIDDPSSIPEHPLNLSLPEGLCPPNNTQLCLSAQACLNHSGPPEECFWNQQSKITGVFCQECVKLCRSERTSLNFAQFLFGLFVFSLAFPICRISTTVLISDSVGKEGQSFIMGVFVASGSISKAIGPPIGVALMLRARRRTFSVMFPMIGMLGAVLVVFLALYRKLSPKQEELHPDRSQLETTSDDDKEMIAFFSSEEEEDDFKEKDDCGLGSAGSETIL